MGELTNVMNNRASSSDLFNKVQRVRTALQNLDSVAKETKLILDEETVGEDFSSLEQVIKTAGAAGIATVNKLVIDLGQQAEFIHFLPE